MLQATNVKTKRICSIPLLIHGIWLGVKITTAAGVLFWGVLVVAFLGFSIQANAVQPYSPSASIMILIVVTEVTMLILGVVGGATNVCILYQLSTRGKLSKITSVSSGLLVGFLAGFSVIVGMVLLAGNKLEAEDPYYFSLIACIATLGGAWHGLMLGRWFMKDSDRSQIGR